MRRWCGWRIRQGLRILVRRLLCNSLSAVSIVLGPSIHRATRGTRGERTFLLFQTNAKANNTTIHFAVRVTLTVVAPAAFSSVSNDAFGAEVTWAPLAVTL